MLYLKVSIPFLAIYALWRVLLHHRFRWGFEPEESNTLFLGMCIILAAVIIAGGVN